MIKGEALLDPLYKLGHIGYRGFVDFTSDIKPVCLPCNEKSCIRNILRKPDSKGEILIKGTETPEQQCQIERKICDLLGIS